MKALLFSLICLGACLFSNGQGKDYLLVYQPGKKGRYTYLIGQEIVVKPVRNFPTLKGVIRGFGDSSIYFGMGDSIHFAEIESIVVNEDPRVFSKNLWLSNLVVSTGTIGLWQIMYWVNTGGFSPDIRTVPGIIAFVTLSPIAVNSVARLVTRTECKVSDGSWKIGVVKMPIATSP